MDPLTEKSRAEVLAELTKHHRDLLRSGERFDLVAAESARGVRARLSLFGGEDGTRVELEARVDRKAGLDSEAALGLVLDALDLSVGEYLEAGRNERLSSAFEERELEGASVFVRGRVRQPALEAEADRLLGERPEDDWDD